jgi:hypothetical protein
VKLAKAALGLSLASCAHAGSGVWLDAFAAYPRARELCNEHIAGSSMEVAWRSYASTASADEVIAFYKQAHPRLVDAKGQDLLTLRAPGEKALAVMDRGGRAPSCGEAPREGERTIIVVSQAFAR